MGYRCKTCGYKKDWSKIQDTIAIYCINCDNTRIFEWIEKNEFRKWIIKVLFIIPVFLLSGFIHEIAHIFTAYAFGAEVVRFEFAPIGWYLSIAYTEPSGYIIRMAGGFVQTLFMIGFSKVYVKNIKYVGILTLIYMVFETFLLFDLAIMTFVFVRLAFAVIVALDVLNIKEES